jgi:hypothetical protein
MFAIAAQADAGGSVYNLPTAYGWQVSLDTQWVEGQGYRPVRVRAALVRPATSDRTLDIELLTRCGWRNDHDMAIRQSVLVPAGTMLAETIIAVPDMWGNDAISVRFKEDGQELPKLELPWTGWSGQTNSGDGAMPMILVLSDDNAQAIQDRLQQALPPEFLQFDNTQTYQVAGPASTVPTSILRLRCAVSSNILQAPERWIDYSSLDVITVAIADLERLKSQRPAAFHAVVDWTAAGGSLCVSGVPAETAALERLHKLLGLPAAEAVVGDTARQWKRPENGLWGRAVIRTDGRGALRADGPVAAAADDHPSRRSRNAAVCTPRIRAWNARGHRRQRPAGQS